MISALPSARAGGSRHCPIRLFKRAEILAMLAAGRASADSSTDQYPLIDLSRNA